MKTDPPLLDYAQPEPKRHRHALLWSVIIALIGGVVSTLGGYGATCWIPMTALLVGWVCSSWRHESRYWFGTLAVLIQPLIAFGLIEIQVRRQGRPTSLDDSVVLFLVFLLYFVPGLFGVTIASARDTKSEREIRGQLRRGAQAERRTDAPDHRREAEDAA